MTLAEFWTTAATSVGVAHGTATDGAVDLINRYSEPHRRYHNVDHVLAVVRHSAELAHDRSAVDKSVLTLAACAHDVVYDAKPGADERASAAWARRWLSGASERLITRVEQLVLATIEHKPSDDDLAPALLDADLAILGAAAERYDWYAAAVREEYAAVPEEMWRTGRAHVLRGMLEHDRLFTTADGFARWEAQARANVARELSGLQR
ncbi:hypothetical protein [Antrihabitans stalactiti]|uniref:Metal-dependent HD superfamily phosphohydrolase n=1 Tax=Antrihabitans stalactiti TaxID=2584121 RepID=A0A848KHA5_9NOCA|nr:hypothetical protein [Antrihabitans stalactiti]NMN96092.1 hypothetical protein [Antrihabitans stalactiti]